MNYFKLFDLTEQFEIDLNLLHRKYLDLQLKNHPDLLKHQGNNSTKPSFSLYLTNNTPEDNSAYINRAYEALVNEFLRAEHLLEISQFERNRDVGTKFLEQTLTNFEELEYADSASEIEEIILKNQKSKEELLAYLKEAFDTKNFVDADLFTSQLKYINNLLQKAQTKYIDKYSL